MVARDESRIAATKIASSSNDAALFGPSERITNATAAADTAHARRSEDAKWMGREENFA